MWCKNCGQELADGSLFCIVCGTEQSYTQEPEKIETYTNEQEAEKTEYNDQQVSPVKKGQSYKTKIVGIFGMICMVIIGSIFGYIGKMAGSAAVGAVEEKSVDQEIEEFINYQDTYESGTCTELSYESEFWNLRFDVDDSWIMCTEEEREILSEQTRASGVASAKAATENMDVDEELINKMLDALYTETEMAAGYMENGYFIGEVVMNVMGMYQISESDEATFLLEMMSEYMGSQNEDVQYGVETIGGELYQTLRVVHPAEGGNLVSHVFLRIEENMICAINCNYYEGNEHVLESFLNQCSEY